MQIHTCFTMLAHSVITQVTVHNPTVPLTAYPLRDLVRGRRGSEGGVHVEGLVLGLLGILGILGVLEVLGISGRLDHRADL